VFSVLQHIRRGAREMGTFLLTIGCQWQWL